MTADEIITTLQKHLDGSGRADGARFVFHSETAALFWAQAALTVFHKKTIARERFVAWDVFKAENLSVHIAGKKAVSQPVRLLFARALCAQNAAAPFLKTIIPIEYARDGQLFANNIASMFSSLKLWRKKTEEARTRPAVLEGGLASPEDFHDLEILESKYETFLHDHNLFESSWERPPFKDKEHDYYIFYPSLIEDFAEYEDLLNVDNVHKINIALRDEDDDSELLLYESARAELRAAALEIRRLHDGGMGYEDIALSAGGLDVLEPYIKREFMVYNIPYNLRSGKALSGYTAGAFFSLIDGCAQNNFSWTSIEALLTNMSLPWKTPNKNKALLSFGIRHNCVWSYREHGKKKDIWEEAFYPYIKLGAENADRRPSLTTVRLYHHYRKLKQLTLRIKNAKSFAALLKQSKHFFIHLFNSEWTAESSGIIGRCLNELYSLAVIEENYPALKTDSPLEVFCEMLKDKLHVTQTPKTGVNVFAYGVAASIPCAAHFIINANQNALTRLYRPLSYLRQDTRRLLHLEDADISRDLIKSYRQSTGINGESTLLRISASTKAFSGAEIPHSYFNRLHPHNSGKRYIVPAAAPETDLYSEERNWWKTKERFPALLFPLQKKGFVSWRFFTEGAAYSFLEEPVPRSNAAASLINNKITLVKRKDRNARQPDGKLRISATSLNAFFTCPVYWLYRDIIKLKKLELRAKMLDDRNKGILYHEILCELFAKIQENDHAFLAVNEARYRSWAEEIAQRQAKTFKSFRGPLAAPLIGAMARSIARNIAKALETEAKNYDTWSVVSLEQTYIEDWGALILTGKIDRVSLSPEYMPLIVDYKTGDLPAKNECLYEENAPLRDFQMSLYLRLYEQEAGKPVEEACFIHAVRGDMRRIVSAKEGRTYINREQYQKTMNALESFITRHADAVNSLDFVPREVKAADTPDFSEKRIPLKTCFRCDYKSICRTTYAG